MTIVYVVFWGFVAAFIGGPILLLWLCGEDR